MSGQSRSHSARALAVGATALALTLAGAGPAFAQTPGPTPAPTPAPTGVTPQQATPTERAAAEVRPAIVYITETFTGFVADETGTYFNHGDPYELSVTCTGFGVNPNGYVATAGHCVDVTSPNGIRAEFVAAAARDVVAGVPGVTMDEAMQFGTANWTVEGTAKGSPIDAKISVVSGSIEGGAQGRSLPARVVDARPFDKGDVALLKVETTDLPSVELAGDTDVQVGTPLLSVGYPASADAVTDPSLEPSNKDGKISSKRTVGSMPVYETSAALTPGMSGGPTVDLDGRVLGVNSFMPAGESQPFNFVAPASGLTELLSRNGVKPELGNDDRAYRAALDAYYAGHYTDAIARFDRLLQVAPQHAQAQQFRTLAAKARDRFGDVPVAQAPAPAPASTLPFGLTPVLFWSIVGGGGALVAGLVLVLVLSRRRRPAVGAALPEPAGPVGGPWSPQPGQAAYAWPPAPASAMNASAMNGSAMNGSAMNGSALGGSALGGSALNGSALSGSAPDGPAGDGSAARAGAATVVATLPGLGCSACGTPMASGARFCSTCGRSRD